MTQRPSTTTRRSKPRKVPPAPRAPMRRVIIPDVGDGGDGDGEPPRLMFKPEVCRLTGHSFPTIWKWMRAGTFPLSFDIGSKSAWRADEINAWLAGRPRSKFKESV